MSNLSKIHHRMLDMVCINKDAYHFFIHQFRNSIKEDIRTLIQFQQITSKFIWIVKPDDVVLIPLKVGINPLLLARHLYSETGLEAHIYLIDIVKGTIEPITHIQAECFIGHQPIKPSITNSELELITNMQSVLDKGKKLKAWGEIDLSSDRQYWPQWSAFFLRSKNQLMFSLIGKTLLLLKQKEKGRK